MPLPPSPTQMGSILKDSELLEKASVEVIPEAKSVKTKKAPVAKKTIKESVAKPKVKATKTPAKATASITKEETKKSKGYRAKTHGKKLLCSTPTCLCTTRCLFSNLKSTMSFYP